MNHVVLRRYMETVGIPLHSAGDLVAFMKASTKKTAYNASLCKHLQEKRQTCINMCTRIKLQ